MNPYALFKTDQNLEAGQGVKLEYDGFSITIHRAGGGNRKYQTVFSSKIAPHRRKVDQGTLAEDVMRRVLAETYAESVITGWENVTDEQGKPIEFTTENVTKLLLDLPELFNDIINSATDLKNFRAAAIEADAKN